MNNPGPKFVSRELKKIGYKGNITYINGDSHKLIPKYFKDNPNEFFDIITVDGDHSADGASLDLRDVLPHLKIGGVVIFDDICQRNMEYLRKVWKKYVSDNSRYRCWEYDNLGLGIAVGIRQY